MIKGILFAVFVILFLGSVGFIVWAGLKKYNANSKEEHKLSNILVAISVILCVVMLGLLVCVPGSFHQVDTGTVAVVRSLGNIKGTHSAGTYYDFYMTNKYEVYDAKVQQDKITTMAYSKDGQTMELEIFLQYQIQTENVVKIATEYGNLEALQARLETVAIEKTKAVMSSAEAMTIIKDRALYSAQVSATVRDGISEDYYVSIKDVVLTNIDFTDEFEKSVENKVIAEQEKQAAITKAEADKQTAITKAEAELEVAKLDAQKKIEQSRGDADAKKIVAQATAEAATYKIIELAEVIGYQVDVQYIYSVTTRDDEGTVVAVVEQAFADKQSETEDIVYIGAEYIIDITSGPGADNFGKLVEDYLEYLAYLEVWNGELPEVVAGDDALSIIVPNN